MLYALYEIFNFKFFSYITVRAGAGFFVAFLLTAMLMPRYILFAKRRRRAQPILADAPKAHQAKNHTPTMGGLVFAGAALAAILLTADLANRYVQLGFLTIAAFAFIGFLDDSGKVLKADNKAGLTPRGKLALQGGFGLIIAALIYFYSHLDGTFYLPFMKRPFCDLGTFAICLWALVLVASSNAVNLTDGLDGLATVPAIFAVLTLGVFAYLTGNAVFSGYLLLPKFIGVGELVVLVAAFVGALLGFLWYNCYPAQVFMGDTGSLCIGGFVGFLAVCVKAELLLFVVGFVFVIETLSVILQVGSFKLRKKRIFRMAPLHHHFEMKGWSENKIIVRFWIIALLTNLIALAMLKIR